VLAGQDAPRCGDPDPEISISVCSALIQSGKARGRELAVAHTARGVAYVTLLDYDRALTDFGDAIAADRTFAAAFANRAAVHAAKQGFELAIADLSQVLKLEPSAIAFADRAGMYRLNGQNDQAIRDYGEAIRLNPKFADAILNRAITLADSSRCSEAIPDFTRAIELNPSEPVAHLNRGVCHETMGNDAAALEDFTQHLSLEPRSEYGLERRAAVFFRARRYDLALIDYAQALIVNPSSPVALYGRGVVKLVTGDKSGELDVASAVAMRPGIATRMSARGVKADK
jgi:tetratricopeptide (TPR) repeat protein